MAKSEKGRKPHYNLSCMNKKTGRRGNIGAGWNNDDGSITIVTNPSVVLTDNPDLVIRLFPNDPNRRNSGTSNRDWEDSGCPADDSEAPF